MPTFKPKSQQPKTLPYSGWTPMKDGVSQSLLQKFVVDKDRYHKAVVKGLRETTRKEAMEYGSLFHKLIEVGATMPNFTRQKLNTYFYDYINRKYKSEESVMLGRIAIEQYFLYREWYQRKPAFRYIEAEPVFNQPYHLPPLNFNPNDCINIRIPPGVVIPLRGRIDGVIEQPGNSMWVEENKTKGRVDLTMLQDTIHANIQVMMYALCAQLKYNRPCNGVVYNVIRKPALRQKVAESNEAFLLRIVEDIKERDNWYFTRLEHEFRPGQVETWEREELRPLLYTVYLWWRSIEANPMQPWKDVNGNVNPFHGRRSFGIYDGMTLGKGDFYDLIVYGKNANLEVVKEQFPELVDEDE